MALLERTPSAVFDALSAMMPRLEAYEARTAVEVVWVGRSLKPSREAKKQLEDWNREANGTSPVKRKPSAADLGGVGIGVKVVGRG